MFDRHKIKDDDPSTLADHSHNGIDPSQLQCLGKKASAIHLEQGVPLSSAVVSVLSDQDGLNRDHVQRVVEFANNCTFDRMFKLANGGHKVFNIEGGPADTSDVMNDLNNAPNPTIVKQAHARLNKDEMFIPGLDSAYEFFKHTKGKVKVASEDQPTESDHNIQVHNVLGVRDQLKQACDVLSSKLRQAYYLYNDVAYELSKEAREAIVDGHSPVELAKIMRYLSPSDHLTKMGLQSIADSGMLDGLPMCPPVTKTASEIPHPDHPLTKAINSFVKVAQDYYTVQSALEITNAQFNYVDDHLRSILQ